MEPLPNRYPSPTIPEHVAWKHHLSSGDTFKLNITYTARSATKVVDMSSTVSGTIDDIPEILVETYIPGNVTELDDDDDEVYGKDGQQYWSDDHNEWHIDPLNPEIVNLTKEITENRSTVYDKVKAVYDWIRANKNYSRGGGLKTVSQILESPTGDEDDQAVLFISMARAMGIPAWIQFGIRYDPEMGFWMGHASAQIVIPKKAGGYVIGDIDLAYDLFLVKDPYRLIDWTDNGDGDVLEDYYHAVYYIGQASVAYRFLNITFTTSVEDPMDNGKGDDDDEGLPGFDTLLVFPSILAAIFIIRKRNR